MDQIKPLLEKGFEYYHLISEKGVEYYYQNKRNTVLILGASVLIISTTIWLKNWIKQRRYFKRCNLPGPKPLPLVGNMIEMVKKTIPVHDKEIIEKYGKTLGYFEGTTPIILTTDVKFIKSFMIKDFSSFVNRRVFESLNIDPIDKFLSVLKDEEWKNVRSIVSGTFTSGKLKSMSKCILNCFKSYENHLDNIIEKDGIIATKQFYGSFTLDVISSCCFGFETNAIEEPNNEFLFNIQNVLAATAPDKNPKFILLFIAPTLANFLAKRGLIEFLPKKHLSYLQNAIDQIIDRRKKKLERRDDFIQSIIEHEDNTDEQTKVEDENSGASKTWSLPLKKTLSNNEILSQALLFLVAGYETTATALEFITYNLAKNPRVQEELIKEIDNVLENHNGEVNYDSINEMKYLDQVIEETLRMYPPVQRTDRVAGCDYTYEGIKINKGQFITIPIYALHHDASIYPNPDEFRPERFSDSEKKARESVAFCPFGAGPRNCIGMRFAITEIKLLLASIQSKFRFENCDKTPEKIVLDGSGMSKSTKPIYVKVTRR